MLGLKKQGRKHSSIAVKQSFSIVCGLAAELERSHAFLQEFRAGSVEQEYILRVVQRAGEKAVKCLKSRGRQRLGSAAVVA